MAEFFMDPERTVILGDDVLEEAVPFLKAELGDPREAEVQRITIEYDE